MTRVTIITEKAITVESEIADGRVAIAAADLNVALGWEITSAGLCRGDVCVPVRDPDRLWAGERVDVAAVAAVLGRSAVVDLEVGIMAIALGSEPRRRALEGLEAPPFRLPDLDGEEHELDEWSGRKKLLVTFSSWCGCRYDLPGWQMLHDELESDGFTALAIAIDNSPDDVRPWVEGISFPVLVDSNHVVTELYAISNVPTVLWIDEKDRIVRPNGVAFGTDTFRDFTGVAAQPHLDAVRRWVREGVEPMGDQAARGAVDDLSDDEITARLHFRVAAEALRSGDETTAHRHFVQAGKLAPHDWTVRRAAMPLMGQDPFGEKFFTMYEEWQEAGMPYHGIPADVG